MRFSRFSWVWIGALGLVGLLLWGGRLLPPSSVRAAAAAVSEGEPVSLAGFSHEVFSVEAAPRVHGLWVAAKDGLYHSKDGGKAWFHIALPVSPAQAITALKWSPEGSVSLWVGTPSGLFQGSGDPLRWRRLLPGVHPIDALAADPAGRRLLASSQRRVWSSQDGGRRWIDSLLPVEAGPPVRALAIHPGRPGLYFAATSVALLMSEDSGRSWRIVRRIGDGPEDLAARDAETEDLPPAVETREEADPDSGGLAVSSRTGIIYAGTARGILASRDFGKTWDKLPASGFGLPAVRELFPDPLFPGRLYAATREGLFMYEEDRGSWEPLLSPMPAGSIHAITRGDPGESLWLGGKSGLFRMSLQAVGRPAQGAPWPAPNEAAPTVQQLQQMVIRYSEVSPEKIRNWRVLSRWKALVPKLTLGLDEDRDPTVVSSTSGGVTRFSVGPERRSLSLGVDFTWDLADLVWSTDQTSIDVRSRLMVQLRQDLLQEATRIYFERRRLLTEFARNPTADPALESERALRIQELTGYLDAFTGGGFSRAASPVPLRQEND